MTGERASPRILLAAVVIAGLNLRTIFASLPPLLHDVRADLGLSAGVAGLLTTGPVICFGALASLAPELARRAGIERLLAATALLAAAGAGLRGTGGLAGLFAGTLLAGAAVAIAQTLVPILVRIRFPDRVGLFTGAFSTTLTLGAAVAAGTAVPLDHVLGGWRGALAFYAVPAAIAAAIWLVPAAGSPTTLERATHIRLRRHGGGPWSVAVYFGLQAMAFYTGLTWLPSILEAHGFSESAAGGLLALASLIQFVPAFLVPIWAGRRSSQTSLLVGVVLAAIGPIVGLIAAPGAALLWMPLLGIAQGGALGLSLILPVLRGGSGPAVASLMAMTLAVGYLLAACGPFLAGLAHDASGGWTASLLFLLAITVAELAVGIPATRSWRVD